MACCELDLGGPLADSLLDLIRSRFGEVTTRRGAGSGTTLVVRGLDPAAERALMTLLWDTGHDVVSMRSTRLPRRDHPPREPDADQEP